MPVRLRATHLDEGPATMAAGLATICGLLFVSIAAAAMGLAWPAAVVLPAGITLLGLALTRLAMHRPVEAVAAADGIHIREGGRWTPARQHLLRWPEVEAMELVPAPPLETQRIRLLCGRDREPRLTLKRAANRSAFAAFEALAHDRLASRADATLAVSHGRTATVGLGVRVGLALATAVAGALAAVATYTMPTERALPVVLRVLGTGALASTAVYLWWRSGHARVPAPASPSRITRGAP